MSNKKSKTLSHRLERLHKPPLVLKVYCSTPIAKPLNGSLQKGSHLLKLAPVSYTYGKQKDDQKAKTVDTYYIKGIRGALRHKVMELCYQVGLEVCHTMEVRKAKGSTNGNEDTTKKDNGLDKREDEIPSGFHGLGVCAYNGGSCIVHQVFGSMRQESLISITITPIVSVTEKTAVFQDEVQRVHIATEHRHAASVDGTPMQDFTERYFSGEFTFEIDVTLCSPEQLGLLITAATKLDRLGRGYNAGYAHIKVHRLQLVRREVKDSLVWCEQDQVYVVKAEAVETILKEEVPQALTVWQQYVEAKAHASGLTG
ncbi:MAG: RAMP superfamily CRISPR-associated protein [Promethearchaeota archaeon]